MSMGSNRWCGARGAGSALRSRRPPGCEQPPCLLLLPCLIPCLCSCFPASAPAFLPLLLLPCFSSCFPAFFPASAPASLPAWPCPRTSRAVDERWGPLSPRPEPPGARCARAAPRRARGSPAPGIVLQTEGVIDDSADITRRLWPRVFVVAACHITSGDCYFSSDETTYL